MKLGKGTFLGCLNFDALTNIIVCLVAEMKKNIFIFKIDDSENVHFFLNVFQNSFWNHSRK